MLLYLVQHAEAKRKEEDPSRPLSEKGLEDIKEVASYLSRMNVKVKEIFHSSKLRAKQTAEILAENVKPERGISEVNALSPLDDPKIWTENLRDITDDTMLVGHLPHLSKLASMLLCGNEEREVVAFRMAGVVCLRRDDTGVWSLQWMITPEIVL